MYTISRIYHCDICKKSLTPYDKSYYGEIPLYISNMIPIKQDEMSQPEAGKVCAKRLEICESCYVEIGKAIANLFK